MPVVEDDLPNASAPQPNVVRIAEPEYQSVTVDSRYEPSASLLINVEGSSWIANYFSQILGQDNTVSGQQPSLDPVYQQYRLIKDFELKVTTALTSSQDPDSNTMKLTGAANVYPFLIPNVGDMFIADVGDGREGIFRVTETERRSIFKDTCYSVQYDLVAIADKTRSDDLYSKVQQDFVFVKDFLQHGQNPMLKPADFEVAKRLETRFHELAELYFTSYVSREYRTLVLPQQDQPTYDHFLAKVLPKLFSTWDATELRNMRVMNLDDDQAMRSITIWDALVEKNPRRLKQASKQTKLVSARLFTRDPMLEGIFWSGLRYVVYPVDPTQTVNLDPLRMDKIGMTIQELQEYEQPAPELVNALTTVRTLADLIGDPTLDELPYGDSPMIRPVLGDGYYVLSQNFYDRITLNQSKLEMAVWDYLNDKPVDRALLLAFCETFHSWGTLERFYYMPIVLLLIKSSIRSL